MEQKLVVILGLSVKQHHKHIQINKDKKEERNNVPIFVYPVSINLSYIWGREQLSNPLSKSSYKEITNGLQEISTIAHKEQEPNFYPFFQSHKWTSYSMIFTHKVITMFPNPREPLYKDTQP